MVTETVMQQVTKFLEDTLAAFSGGIALTAALFWLGERVYPTPRVSGRWFCESWTTNTAMNPFRGMLLKHEVFLWQEESTVRGTSEKIYESSSTGARQYEGENRVRGELNGSVRRNVFAPNRVQLHLTEKAGNRVSTTYFDLISPKANFVRRLFGMSTEEFNSDGLKQERMSGVFQSSAGSSRGESKWSRDRYEALFHQDVRQERSDGFGVIKEMAAEAGLDEARA